MKVKIGDYVKLNKLKQSNVIGQGQAPLNMQIKINKTVYLLPYGGLFKVSSKCDPENKVASMDAKPYPLINKEFVDNNNEIFTKVNKEA